MWAQEELAELRKDSMLFLLTTNKIAEDEIGTLVFTCDSCKEAKDCEWTFHHENIRDLCIKEVFHSEEE